MKTLMLCMLAAVGLFGCGPGTPIQVDTEGTATGQPSFVFVIPYQSAPDGSVPLALRTTGQVTSILLTVAYDSTKASFVGFGPGVDTSDWTLLHNDNPSQSEMSTPGLNRQVRLLIFGGGFKWFTGDGDVAILEFSGVTPLAINMQCDATSVVTFSPVVEYCAPDLSWSTDPAERPVKRRPAQAFEPANPD